MLIAALLKCQIRLVRAARGAGSCSGSEVAETGIRELDPPPDVVVLLVVSPWICDLKGFILELPAGSPHLSAGEAQPLSQVPSPEHLARVCGLEDKAFHVSSHGQGLIGST